MCAQLVLFPTFILNLHGDAWTGAGWTIYAIAVLWVTVDLLSSGYERSKGKTDWLSVVNFHDLRSVLLQVASWSFAISAIEIFVNLVLNQIGAKFNYAFFLGLILVLGIGQLFPLWLTAVIWHAHVGHYNSTILCCFVAGCAASPYWAPLQIASAVSFFFLFGSGFYLGPSFLAADGLVRLTELCRDDAKAGVREDEGVALSAL